MSLRGPASKALRRGRRPSLMGRVLRKVEKDEPFGGGFKFRLGTYNVPSGSRPKHLKTRPKAEFDGGGVGSDRVGWDGNQKCPLIFFIV